MKRTREDIKIEYQELQRQVREIGAKLTKLEDELDNCSTETTTEPCEGTHILVPWPFYRDLIKKDLSIWRKLDINDVYDARDQCRVEDCWYKRNLDRLDNIEIYSLFGECADIKICDVCWSNHCQSEVLPDFDDFSKAEVCLKDYDSKTQELLKENEVKPNDADYEPVLPVHE